MTMYRRGYVSRVGRVYVPGIHFRFRLPVSGKGKNPMFFNGSSRES